MFGTVFSRGGYAFTFLLTGVFSVANSQARAHGAPNRERVNAYALLNARLAYRLVDQNGRDCGELFLAGENLLDRDYRYRPGYPMTGIGGTISVRFKL